MTGIHILPSPPFISGSCIHILKRHVILIKVLEEFYNIFGPELKAVTGDPKRIEDVLVRVGLLVEPIEQVSQHYVGMKLPSVDVQASRDHSSQSGNDLLEGVETSRDHALDMILAGLNTHQ